MKIFIGYPILHCVIRVVEIPESYKLKCGKKQFTCHHVLHCMMGVVEIPESYKLKCGKK